MSDTSGPVEVGLQIAAAMDFARYGGEGVRPHLIETARWLTEEVALSDLTVLELAALVAVLAPAHARVITGRPRPDSGPEGDARVLQLVPRGAS